MSHDVPQGDDAMIANLAKSARAAHRPSERVDLLHVVGDRDRVAAVRNTGLLDSDKEPAFDRLTRLAVRLLDVPTAFFSMVDETRDFYKSACGLGDALGGTRELTGPTFCHYAIQSRAPLVISDTAADPVYREVPTVRTLEVAAYVGVPVVVDEQVIGSFCVIDVVPREWTEAEVEVLVELAASAEREIGLRAAVTTARQLSGQLQQQVTEVLATAEEARRLSHELEVERRRLVDVFAQAPSFLAVMRGPQHVFTLVNDAYTRLIGGREVVGQPMLAALPEFVGQGLVELVDEVLATGVPWVGRERPVSLEVGGTSQQHYVDLVYLPLVEGAGERAGVIAHGTDVTESVTARRRVEHLLAESERANRFQASFLGSMSHEFRTPLHAIGGYAQLLELEISGPLTPTQREHVTRLQASNMHMLRLVDDMLDLAKLDAGELEIRSERGVVSRDVADAVALTAPQATARGIVLIDETQGSETAYWGDEQRVRQVLVNLLSNAIKFSNAGTSVHVRVRVVEQTSSQEHAAGGQWVVVDVRDAGFGIAPESVAHIFEPFKQVNGGGANALGGTGLGLAISRQLARKMGGDLTVESRLGIGSVFTLTLPGI